MDNPNKEISSHVCGLDLATFSRLHKWSKTSSLWDKAQKLYLLQSLGKTSLGISGIRRRGTPSRLGGEVSSTGCGWIRLGAQHMIRSSG